MFSDHSFGIGGGVPVPFVIRREPVGLVPGVADYFDVVLQPFVLVLPFGIQELLRAFRTVLPVVNGKRFVFRCVCRRGLFCVDGEGPEG